MWPWEHLAVGYLALTADRHLRGDRPPVGAEAVAAAFGTQFPDLVDKPLAWALDLLPGGLSLAHSVFVAVPAIGLVLVAGRRFGRRALAGAFAIGYASHLAADVFAPLLRGHAPTPSAVLWPLVPGPTPVRRGVLANVRYYFDAYARVVQTPSGAVYLATGVAAVIAALAVWRHDGYPGGRTLLALLGRARQRI